MLRTDFSSSGSLVALSVAPLLAWASMLLYKLRLRSSQVLRSRLSLLLRNRNFISRPQVSGLSQEINAAGLGFPPSRVYRFLYFSVLAALVGVGSIGIAWHGKKHLEQFNHDRTQRSVHDSIPLLNSSIRESHLYKSWYALSSRPISSRLNYPRHEKRRTEGRANLKIAKSSEPM
jgi:hypothetical protein